LNEPERRNAIHGLTRWSSWRVAERSAERVVLEHVLRPQPGYPFSLALGVEYSLSPDGLAVRTEATNVGAEACPYGAGAHPYLAVGAGGVDEAILRVPARAVLEADERGIPVGSGPVEGSELDFRKPRPIGRARLDHCFADLDRDEDGRARVELDGTTLWADESYPYLMIFTGDGLPDADRRSVAVEPMTCAPNAFSSGDGLIRLEPGDSHAAAWGIAITS
jgi:aldose 1-epimerase